MFAEKLKALRKDAGLSQKELAERAGMAVGSVAQLEQGAREPSWPTVQALSAALGVDCTAFNEPAAKPVKPAKRKRK